MDQLWSPWRSQYINSFSDTAKGEKPGCFLCDAVHSSREDDSFNLVVHRAEHCFVIMNRYPYNAGHVMVVPNEHSGDFAALSPEVAHELIVTMQLSHRVLTERYKPHGYNVGANLGRVAGAGVPDHLHFHIVPRWSGDTNFMPVLAEIKVISESLEETCAELRATFRALR